MKRGTFKSAMVAMAASMAVASAAQAGGFDRGTADTDILFETSRFAVRTGITVVSPSLEITSVLGGVTTSGYEAETYMVPSAAAKFGIGDTVSCAGTYTTPFGAHNNYRAFTGAFGAPAGRDPLSLTGSVEQEFIAHEYAATCAAGFQAGKGKLSFIGGVFLERIDFEQFVAFGTRRFKLDSTEWGYRAGAAYEIPEIAFRAQVMYRSATTHSLTGTVSQVATGTVLVPNATGAATFPQSFEAKLQTGIAEGWLAFGSVKWTDWSVFRTLSYNAGAPSSLNFFWKDGWTVTGGVAHRFNDMVAASLSLTWDRGVGTGHDIQTDKWTVASGVSVTPREDVELRAGIGYTYIEGGSQNFRETGAPGGFAALPGAKVQEAGHAVAGAISLKVKF